MKIADAMAAVVPSVVELRRRAADQPMFPTLVALRNERVVAVVSTPRLAATLHCAQTLAVGLAAEALVVAAQAEVNGHEALAYSVMTRDREAALALQQVGEQDGAPTFGTPANAGEPADPTIMQTLAEAMGQQPMDVTRVARSGDAARRGTFGDGDLFLPAEEGRVVVDAGTLRTVHDRVREIAGTVLYLPRSEEAGRLALEAGLPRACLLTAG